MWHTCPSLQLATWGGTCRRRSPELTCCAQTPETPSSSVSRDPPAQGAGLGGRGGAWEVGQGAACHSRCGHAPTAPRVEPSSLENVLEPCAYAPTYVVKDFPIARYQGLQFVSAREPPGTQAASRGPLSPAPRPQVYLSFVYPNDHTRLTHMETENKCFYRESPLYLERWVGRVGGALAGRGAGSALMPRPPAGSGSIST